MGYCPAPRVNPLNGISITQGPISTTASAPSQTTVGLGAATVLPANPARLSFMLQNLGTTVIYIGLGANPTSSAFHISLPAGGTVRDGSSRIYQDACWKGSIAAVSSAIGGLLSVTEFT